MAMTHPTTNRFGPEVKDFTPEPIPFSDLLGRHADVNAQFFPEMRATIRRKLTRQLDAIVKEMASCRLESLEDAAAALAIARDEFDLPDDDPKLEIIGKVEDFLDQQQAERDQEAPAAGGAGHRDHDHFKLADRLSIHLHGLHDQAMLVALAIDALEVIDTASSFTSSPDGLRYGTQKLLRDLERAVAEFSEFAQATGVFAAGGQADG